MRVRSVVLAVFALAIAACSESSTAPASSANSNQISLVVARLVDTSSAGSNIGVGFGVNPADSVFGYGLPQLWVGSPILGTVIETGETASLAINSDNAVGMFSNGKTQTSVRLTSDWQPVDAQHHSGVQYSSTLETDFQVFGYQYNLATNVAGSALPVLFFSEMTTVSNPSVVQNLPLENNTVRQAFFAQRRQITCSGTDSLLFHSVSGTSVTTTDVYGTTTQVASIPDVMVYCSVYQNVSEARLALSELRSRRQ